MISADDRQVRRRLFADAGLIRAVSTSPSSLISFLRSQRERLHAAGSKPRPWHYHEIHNPWSPAATVFDSWGFLDLCQAPLLLDTIADLIGPDVILYDSQWLPDPWDTQANEKGLQSDSRRFPVEPVAGLTVLIHCGTGAEGSARIRYLEAHHRDDDSDAIIEDSVAEGDVLFLDARLRYKLFYAGTVAPQTYAIRYFPATSTYLRAPHSDVHRGLTRRYPLLNYARLPLWLVHGTDRAENDFVTGFVTRAGFWT